MKNEEKIGYKIRFLQCHFSFDIQFPLKPKMHSARSVLLLKMIPNLFSR